MKTGRVRKKAEPPPDQQVESVELPEVPPAPESPGTEPAATRAPRPVPIGCLAGLAIGLLAVVILVVLVGGRRGAAEWIPATRADGSWTTTVIVFGPQVLTRERWEADCANDSNATVQAGTCTMRDTNVYQDTEVDDYEEYAYNVYLEETWGRVYEAQGTEFVVTALGSDDWWEGNLHYTLEEELDRDSCQYTNYTIWVDDRSDSSQEVEVYLSECEVWDQVTVSERVYEQQPWCQCDVTTLVQVGELAEQGTGSSVLWASPDVPSGGRTEQAFRGRVTFVGGDYTHTVTTTDVGEYQRYLTDQYYLGATEGRVVMISASPPEE